MNTNLTFRAAAALVVLGLTAPLAVADEATEDKIRAAMAADIRTPEETARDRNRRPLETLQFFGLRDDMKVLELLPGGGWYTKILAPTLRAKGTLFVAIGTGRAEGLKELDGMDRIKVIETGRFGEREGAFRPLHDVDFGRDDLDLVLTFRNMHNLTPEGRATLNVAVYEALRSGGRYGVIDHTRRHMEGGTQENRRRMDPVVVIQELLDVGFEFVGFSDLHYRADDELRFEVGRRSVSGNTDRFTLLFEKP